MRKIFQLLTLLLCSCAGTQSADLSDFSEIIYHPQHAEGFKIHQKPDSKSTLLKISNPWQGAENIEQLTFLQREGEKTPTNFNGQTIKVPAQRIVSLSSSYVAMLDAVNQTDKIVGVSGIDFIYNPKIDKTKVVDIGYDTKIDYEKLAALNPSVILIYALNSENSALTGKLKELNIPYIYIGDYLEQSPLGKAEWMLALAELTDSRELAEQKFKNIEQRYNTLKQKAQLTQNKPQVMLNAPYRDVWFMPSSENYMVRLITDAGAKYAYQKNTGSESTPITLEQAYTLASKSDFWLNTGWHNNLEQLLAETPKFKTSNLVKKGKIYNNNSRQSSGGGSDFWESGVIAPDKILEDLINIFSGKANSELFYYKQLE